MVQAGMGMQSRHPSAWDSSLWERVLVGDGQRCVYGTSSVLCMGMFLRYARAGFAPLFYYWQQVVVFIIIYFQLCDQIGLPGILSIS